MEPWLKEAYAKLESMPEQAKAVRKAAETDLVFFAKLVNPGYMYGNIHEEVYRWMMNYHLYGQGEAFTENKLIMLPRAHLKSHMVATWCAWMIVRHPEITILYTSATAELAISQLYDIKNILESSIFKKYWPEYIKPDVGTREKWSQTKIIIDHPKRKKEGIRDATIACAGLTTNTTGWHADVICADDLVVPENAYTEDGRESVSKKASQFTSIRNTGGFTMACGTRYHPGDVYGIWKEATYEAYSKDGDPLGKYPVWDVKEYAVEYDGVYTWPRSIRSDGKAFGFDQRSLARIEAEYTDKIQFFAQYYNNPNDPGSAKLDRSRFQYFNPRYLKKENGSWYYSGKRLNIYAAVDFAYSLSARADWTAIVVIGIDSDGDIFVLDIERFKSFKVIEYFEKIKALHSEWGFKKLQAEVTAAQKTIVESIKDYVRKDGLKLKVEEYRPSRQEGSKQERIDAILEHRYSDLQMWHREGGWTSTLEEELILARPAHDDIKDALASAVSIAVRPSRSAGDVMKDFLLPTIRGSRFGGYAA
jgi:predicted phage terminase large subunit-like protein